MSVEITYFKTGHKDAISGFVEGPNSAGGVSVKFNLYNSNPEKTVKYADFFIKAYNAVGDEAVSAVNGECIQHGRVIGPIESNKIRYGVILENLWYNNTITRTEVDHADVTYMDGTTETVEGQEIMKINTCESTVNTPDLKKLLTNIGSICFVLIAIIFIICMCLGDF